MDKRLGGPQSRRGLCEEKFLPYRASNSDSSVIHPIASRYTNRVIPTRTKKKSDFFSLKVNQHICLRWENFIITTLIYEVGLVLRCVGNGTEGKFCVDASERGHAVA
jgi:hypothetical protein